MRQVTDFITTYGMKTLFLKSTEMVRGSDQKDVSTYLKNVGYNPETVPFLPVASFHGDNIAKKSEKMSWYTGPTLLEQLDLFKAPENQQTFL